MVDWTVEQVNINVVVIGDFFVSTFDSDLIDLSFTYVLE